MKEEVLKSQWSWFASTHGRVMHYLPGLRNAYETYSHIAESGGRVRHAACGLRAKFHTLGAMDRIDGQRCKHCCKALGIRKGYGTPLNAGLSL